MFPRLPGIRRAPLTALTALLTTALTSASACHFDPAGITGDIDDPADAAPPAAPDAAVCPAGYVRSSVTGTYFRLELERADWHDAEARCEADGPGTHLAVLDSPSERDWLDARTTDPLWIGVSDLLEEGTYLRVLGDPAGFLPWSSNEPNDFFGEDCVELAGSVFNDEDCSTENAFACECDGLTPIPTAFPKP